MSHASSKKKPSQVTVIERTPTTLTIRWVSATGTVQPVGGSFGDFRYELQIADKLPVGSANRFGEWKSTDVKDSRYTFVGLASGTTFGVRLREKWKRKRSDPEFTFGAFSDTREFSTRPALYVAKQSARTAPVKPEPRPTSSSVQPPPPHPTPPRKTASTPRPATIPPPPLSSAAAAKLAAGREVLLETPVSISAKGGWLAYDIPLLAGTQSSISFYIWLVDDGTMQGDDIPAGEATARHITQTARDELPNITPNLRVTRPKNSAISKFYLSGPRSLTKRSLQASWITNSNLLTLINFSVLRLFSPFHLLARRPDACSRIHHCRVSTRRTRCGFRSGFTW